MATNVLEHVRYTFSGVVGSTNTPLEQWSFRLQTGAEAFADDAARLARATAARSVFDNNIRNIMPPEVILTRVRVSQHEAGGLVSRDAGGEYNQADNTESLAGAAPAGTILPLQTALCVSLDTTRSGPRGRGRIYLPWPGYALDASHRISVANQTTMANAVAEFIRDLNGLRAIPGANDEVSVFSTFGVASPVVAVRVGRAPDTQRSRRADVPEDYLRVAV